MNEHATCPECAGYTEEYQVRHVTELRPPSRLPRRIVHFKTKRLDIEIERLARIGWAVDEIGAEFGLSHDEVTEVVGYGRIARHDKNTARSVGSAYLRRVAKEMDDYEAAEDA